MKILESIKAIEKFKVELLFFMKFLTLYSFFYFGFMFWIGYSTPGNYYSPFAEKYLNLVRWLRESLVFGVETLMQLFGYEIKTNSTLRKINVANGHGVTIANVCLGYGVMSVWAAFVLTYPSSIIKKIKWLIGGLMTIWFTNLLRILTLLLLVNQPKKINVNQFGDHHDVYNIIAYAIIIAMIFFYTKEKKPTIPTAPLENPS